jgi:hypothetical protein
MPKVKAAICSWTMQQRSALRWVSLFRCTCGETEGILASALPIDDR